MQWPSGSENHLVSLSIGAVGVLCHSFDHGWNQYLPCAKHLNVTKLFFFSPPGAPKNSSFLHSSLNLHEDLPWECCAVAARKSGVQWHIWEWMLHWLVLELWPNTCECWQWFTGQEWFACSHTHGYRCQNALVCWQLCIPLHPQGVLAWDPVPLIWCHQLCKVRGKSRALQPSSKPTFRFSSRTEEVRAGRWWWICCRRNLGWTLHPRERPPHYMWTPTVI